MPKPRKDILAVRAWRVGGVKWLVDGVPKFTDPDDVGECDPHSQTIRMLRKLRRPMKIRTLCHELAHALGLGEREAGCFEALAGILIEHGVL
jgi:hypothetical protein